MPTTPSTTTTTEQAASSSQAPSSTTSSRPCGGALRSLVLAIVGAYMVLVVDKPLLPESIPQPVLKIWNEVRQVLINVLKSIAELVDSSSSTSTDGKAKKPKPDGGKSDFDRIPELNSNGDLQQALSEDEFVFVMFYADWCGHCRNMKPAFAKLYNDYQNDPSQYNAAIYRVNHPDNGVNFHSLNVKGYPTLYLISNDAKGNLEIKKYEGYRTFTSMKKFIQDFAQKTTDGGKKPKPDDEKVKFERIPELNSTAELEQVVAKNQYAFVMFYADWCGHCNRMKPAFAKLYNDYQNNPSQYNAAIYRVNHPVNGENFHSLNVKGYPTLYLISNEGYLETKKYEGDRTFTSMKKFIQDFAQKTTDRGKKPKPDDDKVKFERIPELNSTAELEQVGGKNQYAFVMFYADWCGHCNRMKPAFAKLYSDYQNNPSQYNAAIYRVNHPDNGENFHSLNVKGYPTLYLISNEEYLETKKYEGDRTFASMKKFIQDFAQKTTDGGKKPKPGDDKVKFEHIPELNSTAELEQVVAKNHYAFVMFYADWCGHCTNFKPTFAKLYKRYQNNPSQYNAAIYRVNHPDNQRKFDPNIVAGYPTLLMISKNNKGALKTKQYKGVRSIESMEKFIQDYSQKTTLSTSGQVKNHIKKNPVTFVVYSPTIEVFDTLSSELSDIEPDNAIYTSSISDIFPEEEKNFPNGAILLVKDGSFVKKIETGVNYHLILHITKNGALTTLEVLRSFLGKVTNFNLPIVLVRSLSESHSRDLNDVLTSQEFYSKAIAFTLPSADHDLLHQLNVPLQKESDCMKIFIYNSPKSYGVCFKTASSSADFKEGFKTALKSFSESPQIATNSVQSVSSSENNPIVLDKDDLKNFVEKNPKTLLFVYSEIQKVSAFQTLQFPSDVIAARYFVFMPESMDKKALGISLKKGETSKLFYFVNGKNSGSTTKLTQADVDKLINA